MSSFEYQKSTISKYRSGTIDDPYIDITESKKVINNTIQLNEIPVFLNKVQIDNYVEVPSTSLDELERNQYRVDYIEGIVYFHSDAEGEELTLIYKGRGNHYISVARIWTQEQDGEVVETLKDLYDSGRDAIDNLKFLAELKDEIEEVEHTVSGMVDDVNLKLELIETTHQAVTEQGNWAQNQGDYAKEQGLQVISRTDEVIQATNQSIAAADTAKQRANDAADYAQSHGDFAKIQAQYAEQQGEFAQSQGNYAKEQAQIVAEVLEEAESAIEQANNSSRLANESAASAHTATTETNLARDRANESAQAAEESVTHAQAAIDDVRTALASANGALSLATDASQQVSEVMSRTSHQGEYSDTKTYYPNNIVIYNGSSYMCINESINQAPDTSYSNWKVLSQKGQDGRVVQVISSNQDVLIQGEASAPDLSIRDELKTLWNDKYTKQEIDTKFNTIPNASAQEDGILSAADFNEFKLKEDSHNKGVPSGYAALDSKGKVPGYQLPPIDFVFPSLNSLTSNQVFSGMFVKTLGFYEVNDRGEAHYVVSDTEEPWSISLGDGLYANIREESCINYRMLGAKLDGVSDDYPYMLKAHSYCNSNKVTLKNSFGTIFKTNSIFLEVQSDVDLSGSTIRITNDNCIGWYDILNDDINVYSYESLINKSDLRKDTSYFPMEDNSLPTNSVIHIKDGNKWCVRYDETLVTDEFRGELMFHTMMGMCFGPLISGYDGADTKLNYFKYSKYNSRRLIFTGCRLSIETTPNITMGFLRSRRHNTLITDFVLDPKMNSLTNVSFKGSVITVKDSYNVQVNNISGNNIAGKTTTDGKNSSGYAIRIMESFKVGMANCNLQGYWGATGSNSVKEWSIKNSTLNRIDVHNYFRDINIENCVIYDWGINLGYGTGKVSVKDTTFIHYMNPNLGGRTLVNLNNTYGLIYSGTLHFENINVIKEDNDISLIKLNYVAGDNVPRAKLKLPNLTVKNMEIRNNMASDSKFLIYNFSGFTNSSINIHKIELNDFSYLQDIHYFKADGSKGAIQFIRDTTDGQMYSGQVITDISYSNVDFLGDAVLGTLITNASGNVIQLTPTSSARFRSYLFNDSIATSLESEQGEALHKLMTPYNTKHVLQKEIEPLLQEISGFAGQQQELETQISMLMDLVARYARIVRSLKDEHGIFTSVQYFREGGTLLKSSLLSGGTSPRYTTRTDTYYNQEGNIIYNVERTLIYDSDGDMIAEE
ncbi:hypothetical protein FHR92_004113 [Fontibacillus solani]|uniref:Chitin-binding type-3 domain-containing protein n=1 Tax=Fontibacillus solani TaxID=1572857 RepID=A0A7W3SWW4_9BACL|nr:hypothetical protein [Fontibacillus solani]MBA9087628.1 hypothetical protein [Fontibacillus solani]